MGAEILGRERQAHLLFKQVAVDGDLPSGDEVLAAIEEERDRPALHARGLDREIDLELPATEGKIRSAELGDTHIGETLRGTDADGKDGHRERRHSIQRFLVAVGDAVAEHQNRGLRRAVARGGLQQFD